MLVSKGIPVGVRPTRAVLAPRSLVGNNWARAGAGVTVAAAGAHEAGRRTGHRREGAMALGAAGGAAAGQGAYQLPAYLHQTFVRGHNLPIYMRHGVKQSDLDKPNKDRKRQFERERREWKAEIRDRGMTSAEGYRLYPKHWPNARAERLQGWTHAGRSGRAVGGAATLLGAAGGALAVRSNRHGNRSKVGKALYERERRTSPVRLAEATAGAGLLAWGAPRTRVVGRALARGLKNARAGDNHRAVEAIQRAQALQGVLNTRTGRGSARLRQIQAISDAVDRVPESLRPAVATTAGALLMHQAHPVRQTRYRNVPVRGSAVTGW